jgi:hypothetical protein
MSTRLRVVKPEDPDEPIDRYLHEVRSGTTSTIPYERLMIFYRKQKMFKEELDVIDRGLEMLHTFYKNQQKMALGDRIPPSIKSLSDKISKSMGLHDKKGNELYLPEPIPKWTRRRLVTEQKLKKQTAPAAPKKKAKKKKATKKSK